MKINAVSFSAGRFSGSNFALPHKSQKYNPMHSEVKPKSTDIIPISGLIGAGLVSAYFMRKGQLDMFIKNIHI